MGSRMVNIPAIFAQHFDDIIHTTPSLIKKSKSPKSSHWQCSRNHRCQGWVQIKPVCGRSELFFLHENKKSHRYIKYFALTLVFKRRLGWSWKENLNLSIRTTPTRYYDSARLKTPPKPLFSLKPLDATTCHCYLPLRNGSLRDCM